MIKFRLSCTLRLFECFVHCCCLSTAQELSTHVLHNYVTVDPPAFLSDAKHMEMIYTVCKTVLYTSFYVALPSRFL